MNLSNGILWLACAVAAVATAASMLFTAGIIDDRYFDPKALRRWLAVSLTALAAAVFTIGALL